MRSDFSYFNSRFNFQNNHPKEEERRQNINKMFYKNNIVSIISHI